MVNEKRTAKKKPTKPRPKSVNRDGSKKKKKKPTHESYAVYIRGVLKQVHPNLGITQKTMNIMDAAVADIFDRLCTEAGRLARYQKKSTVGNKEIRTAANLVLSGELAKHANAEATKAVTKFNSASADS